MMPIRRESGSESTDSPTLSTPEWWFEKVVKENFKDFENNPISIRHAFNAVVTASHFYERVWHYHRQQKSLKKVGCAENTTMVLDPTKEFFQAIKKTCTKEERCSLRLMRDIANTAKHQVNTRDGIKGAVATDMARPVDGELRIYDAEAKCYGRTLDLLNTTIRFWENWLAKHPS